MAEGGPSLFNAYWDALRVVRCLLGWPSDQLPASCPCHLVRDRLVRPDRSFVPLLAAAYDGLSGVPPVAPAPADASADSGQRRRECFGSLQRRCWGLRMGRGGYLRS